MRLRLLPAWLLPSIDMRTVANPNVTNTVKAGATVPLKFELFAGNTELTSAALVTPTAKSMSCTAGTEDAIDEGLLRRDDYGQERPIHHRLLQPQIVGISERRLWMPALHSRQTEDAHNCQTRRGIP